MKIYHFNTTSRGCQTGPIVDLGVGGGWGFQPLSHNHSVLNHNALISNTSITKIHVSTVNIYTENL